MDGTRSVGSVVAERPSKARVFERHGIDYCCGGGRSLGEAARQAGVDIDQLVREIEAEAPVPGETDWTRASIREVVDHILREHHDWLRRELPRIDALTEKVARVHGGHAPDLQVLREVFLALRADLEPHLEKEERILFPAAMSLEETGTVVLGCHGRMASLEGPMGRMEYEHVEVGELLARIRALTGGFVAPEEACNSWRALWDALAELDSNTRAHIHLENDVLHVAIRRLEGCRAG